MSTQKSREKTEDENRDKTVRETAEESTVKSYETVFEAESPISHGSDSSQSTRTRLRTLKMAVPDGEGGTELDDIPVVSGNSLRGIIRDLLAEEFIEMIDVELHDNLSNTFWSGGSPDRGSGGGRIKRKRIEKVREYIPPLSLLGGSVGTEILPGKLNMGMLIPVGRETENRTGIECSDSVWDYKDKTYYTRSDDREGQDEDDEKTQMKYEVDILIPGTRFKHSMDLEGVNEVEEACLYRGFELFDEQPYIGGMQRVGHGKVSHGYDFPSSDPYIDHIEDNLEDIREFVLELDEDLK